MAKSKKEKQDIVKNLKDKAEKAKSIVFARFEGLGVKDNEELRNELKSENSEYYVAKKSLIDLSLKDFEFSGLNAKELEGQIAVVFGYEDEVAPAKIIDKYKKDTDGKVDYAGGVLEGVFIGIEEVSALAKLPSKQELYAKLVGSINAPVSGFVNVLAGNIRGLVNVLKAIEEKKA